MSKKHFILIAAVFSGLRRLPVSGSDPQTVRAVLDATAEALADVFAGLNDKFDRARFLAACQK